MQEWEASLVDVVGTGVALDIEVDVALISHFHRKRLILSVILPDPSSLIKYWWSGNEVIIFPVVFHWRLNGLWIATVSPACGRQRLWLYLLYPSTILALWWWRISSWCFVTAIHLRCGLWRIGCEEIELRSRRWSRSYACDGLLLWIGVSLLHDGPGDIVDVQGTLGHVFTFLFAVFTTISAPSLHWGHATEDSPCFPHHIWSNCRDILSVKGGSSSSGLPYVWNSCQQIDINLDVAAWLSFRWYKMS